MKTKKYRVLKIAAVICFLYAIIELALGALLYFLPIGDEVLAEAMQNQEEYASEVVNFIKIIMASVYLIEAAFFLVEGGLIYRAIKKGKTTLIIILLLMGFILPLITLINAAINSTYDINSATNLVSIIIRTIILKQIFEIRRLNMD